MRISKPLLFSIFILLLIALNVFVIPQQKKVQLGVEKKAIWKISTDFDVVYDYALISTNSLIQSISTGLNFQLQSFDKKTGALIQEKTFSNEVGLAIEVVCFGNAIYVAFPSSAIYKLDATTLEVLWRKDWDTENYNWKNIKIEKSKDLILISYFDDYSSLYTFINQESGETFYEQEIDKESIVKEAIPDIFVPQEDLNWGTYYNFQDNQFIFDTTRKTIHFMADHYLVDIQDELSLSSFKVDTNSYTFQKTYERIDVTRAFNTRQKELHVKDKITGAYKKELKSIQTTRQATIFRFGKQDDFSYVKSIDFADYVFLRKDLTYPNFSLQNIAPLPQAYASDDYFVALDAHDQTLNHKEIILLNLKTLNISSFYVPVEDLVLKIFCDQEQVYALIQKSDKETYWLALPIDS